MVLDEIGDYLEQRVSDVEGLRAQFPEFEQSGLSAFPQIVHGYMPQQPDDIVALIEMPSAPPSYAHSRNAKPYAVHPRIEAISRGEREMYRLPRLYIAIVCALLDIRGMPLGDTYYRSIKPVTEPHLFDQDDSQRILLACAFDVDKDPDY